MKLTVNTTQLQEAVSKAVKGAGNNKLIPVTGLLCIQSVPNGVRFLTTDMTNYLYVVVKASVDESFYVTVYADVFAKLISKLTCEQVVLEYVDTHLRIVGNGTYKIEIPLDDEGNVVRFPSPIEDAAFEEEYTTDISAADVKLILNSIRPSLATTYEVPCYTNYYFGADVVATDTYKIASLDRGIVEEPLLLAPSTVDLLDLMTDDKISMSVKEGYVLFEDSNITVYASQASGTSEYQIGAITDLLNTEFPYMCKVSKSALLQTLERVALFVNNYDKNGITLTFTDKTLEISSLASTGVESVPFVEVGAVGDFVANIDIQMLQTQIKAYVGDTVEIYYGLDSSLKLVGSDVVQVVAFLENM